ncbi:hypothetical protein BDQ17DRAFT_1368395 [Cyathus striatus]|nr:hypothetical protein BDQ17DRAFT_1368395 [Cyathus striatus]
MFTDSHHFTIESSNFNDAESITINYNILLLDDAKRKTITSPLGEGEKEKLKELVTLVESLAMAKKEEKTVIGDEADKTEGEEQKSVEPIPESPPVKKRLIVYTNVDIAAKKLKKSVNILFTLTPFQDNNLQSAIVWKILSFQPQARLQETMNWFDRVGFAAVTEKNDGSLKSGDLAVMVKHNHVAVLMSEDSDPFFSEEEVKMPEDSVDGVAISNMTDMEQRFALCTLREQETNSFTPVLDIGMLRPKDIVVWAYAVPSGFRERRQIDTTKLKPLFMNGSVPRAIDIRTCGERTAFRLFTNMRGQIFLERDA